MHRWTYPTTAAALCAIAVAGCGGGGAGAPGATVATTPAAQRSVQQGDVITVRGDYAPDEHGPYALHGRYRVRFTQFGAGVDFRREVPFTAHLEEPAPDGPGKTIRLF